MFNYCYKDINEGIKFSISNEGPFTGEVCDAIKSKLNAILREELDDIWIGFKILSGNNAKYVFGHNIMRQQERGSSRASRYFSFEMMNFNELWQQASLRDLCDQIISREQAGSRNHLTVRAPFMDKTMKHHLAYAMSALQVNEGYPFRLKGDSGIISSAVEYLWKNSQILERMPVFIISYGEKMKKNDVWQFVLDPHSASWVDDQNGIETGYLPPEKQYLFRASYHLINQELSSDYIRCWSQSERTVMKQAANRQVNASRYLLIWHYADQQKHSSLCPSSVEAQKIIRMIR